MSRGHLVRPLTYDDLLAMPDDRNRYEIINGESLVSPTPRRGHREVAATLFSLVSPYVRQRRMGRMFFAPVDVQLGPHDIVAPDLLFIRQDRLAIYRERGGVEGPPDLVVEIIAPSSSSIDPIRKAALHARSRVPEYWLADPEQRTFRLLVRQEDGTYRDAEPVEGRFHSTVIDGLAIDPATLFADLD